MTDRDTAQAFANSWNHLSLGSVYTRKQVVDWFYPHDLSSLQDKTVLELGCGNASLMTHLLEFNPRKIVGVDLGDSVYSAQKNMELANKFQIPFEIKRFDLCQFQSEPFDFVYCIGVIHHLKDPALGLSSVLRNVRSNGKFHIWVYGYEGNALVRWFVEPLRRITSKLPWWITKYLIATPLVVPFFFYAQLFKVIPVFSFLPMSSYAKWISSRDFLFFRHVAFDQLVTPQTKFFKKEEVQKWLDSQTNIKNTYIFSRNENSWLFGGEKI